MVQRNRRETRATAVTVRAVFAPSRVAGECLIYAYAVVVPPGRRQLPATGTAAAPERTLATAEQLWGGRAR